ncbi:hypothetical protein V492_03734 [Pseudogymnoascus sp. VKM F-4246]|nr:hypothetical protein V492_03734 [Pseudogymnoascus sp. VKM F-4246]
MSTASVCWTLADDFSQWLAAGEVGTGKERAAGTVGSVTPTPPQVTAEKASVPALIEQVTCPSLVEEVSPAAPAAQTPNSSLFSIRPSPKGGMGAFALSDIPESTVIMKELALFLATDGRGHLAEELGKLSAEERTEFSKLACYELLDQDRDIAIFKTNRLIAIFQPVPLLLLHSGPVHPAASSWLPRGSTTPAPQASGTATTIATGSSSSP